MPSPEEWRPVQANTQVHNDPLEGQKDELRGSLAAGWEEARKRFRELTKTDLNAFRDNKKDALTSIEKMMCSGNHDIEKQQSTMATIEKVLNCVEFVGSVVAQGVSLVFSQAAMCFSAIEMLINVPRMYKQFLDSLAELFATINEFFPKLKIFQRTDYKLGLDSALITKLNEILIALVDTCALAIKARKGTVSFMAKGLFLKQNDIQDAIKAFKAKIDQLDALTVPVTLEKILETRNISLDSNRRLISIEATGRETYENVQEVQADVKEVSSGVQELLLFNTEGRDLRADQEKIDKIDKALFVSKEAVVESVRPLELCQETLLPGTWFQFQYEGNLKLEDSRNPILIAGERGSGRTFSLSALRQAIVRGESPFDANETTPIWAYHSCGTTPIVESGKLSSPFATALRLMACQIARQSPIYTRILQKEIDDMSDARNTRKLLAKLRFHDLVEQEDRPVYLMFDGLDQVRDLQELSDILSLACKKSSWGSSKPASSWPQLVIAANKDVLMTLSSDQTSNVRVVNMSEVSGALLGQFIEDRIEILQNDSEFDLRRRLKKKLLQLSRGSYTIAQQKLDVMQDAIANDCDFEELLAQLSNSAGSLVISSGGQILNSLSEGLNPNLREQLKEILYWCYWGGGTISTGILDSSLFFLRHRKPLEPLEARIRRHFGSILMVAKDGDENYVMLSDRDVEGFLRQLSALNPRDSPTTRRNGLVRLDLEQRNAIQKILESLGQSFLTGDFSVLQSLQIEQTSGRQELQLSQLEAHWTIAMRCLQALNDDQLHGTMEPLIQYAGKELPRHLAAISKHLTLLEPNQRKGIVSAVVAFFSDSDRIEAAMRICAFYGNTWVANRDNVRAIATILNDVEHQPMVEPRDRRIANKLMNRGRQNSIPFLESLAIVAGHLWLDEKKKSNDAHDAPWQYLNLVQRYLKLIRNTDWQLIVSPKPAQKDHESASSVSSRSPRYRKRSIMTTSTQSNDDTKSRRRRKRTTTNHSLSPPIIKTLDELLANGTLSDDDEPDAAEAVKSDSTRSPSKTSIPKKHAPKSDRRPTSSASASSSDSEANHPTDEYLFPDGSDLNYMCNMSNWFVFRAKNWILKRCSIEEGPYAWLRMARAFLRVDYGLHIAYVRKTFDASKSQDIMFHFEAALEMAKIYSDFKEYSKAIAVLSPVHGLLRDRIELDEYRDVDGIEDACGKVGDEILRLMFEASESMESTLRFIQANSKYAPSNGYFLYHQLRLLLATKQMDDAERVFKEWRAYRDVGQCRIGEYMSNLLKGDLQDYYIHELIAMFIDAKGHQLLNGLKYVLRDAAYLAGENENYDAQGALYFAQGMIFVVNRDRPSNWQAIQLLVKLQDLIPMTNLEDGPLHQNCQKFLTQLYFDEAQMEVNSQPHSPEDKRDLFAAAADSIKQVYAGRSGVHVDYCKKFAVAALMIAGQEEEAHDLVKRDMAYAIELLTDEVNWNDNRGLWSLLRIMLSIGRFEACHSVFSLLGRKVKVDPDVAAPPASVPESDHLDGDENDSMDGSADDRSEFSKSSHRTDATTPADSYVRCRVCVTDIHAQGTNEIWTCKYCHEVDLCTTCYEALKSDKLSTLICNPNHDHLLLKHFDYDEEEIKDDNVRIGWEYEQGSNPRERRRVGKGQIVSLKTWMNMLRDEFDIFYWKPDATEVINIPSTFEYLRDVDPDFSTDPYEQDELMLQLAIAGYK